MKPVMIVGAGPTGLVMACALLHRGAPCRIVDTKGGPSRHSKALGIHARTLELLESIGVTPELVRRGLAIPRLTVHGRRRVIGQVETNAIASRYNFVLGLPQDQTEAVLMERLAALGGRVEWTTRCTGLQATGAGAAIRLDSGSIEETTAPFVVACDGAHSTCRHALGLGFSGERYEEVFFLADVRLEWGLPPHEAQAYLAREGLFLALPLPQAGWYRIVVNTLRPDQDVAENDLGVDHFQRWLENRTHHPNARIVESLWMSRFRISRRIISRFRTGPIFFAGDAAHVHSPAGGQRMNTGIHDAVNLAWKVAAVIIGQAPERLLDSYETERRPVAEAVLKATDRLTRAATVQLGAVQWARTAAVRLMLRSKSLQHYALQRLAELTVSYPASPLNFEGGGGPRPGQRAPDGCVESASAPSPTRLYDCFHPTHWQLLAFDGKACDWASDETFNALIASYRETLAVLYLRREQGDHPQQHCAYHDASGAVFQAYGADRPTLVLLRPDRYIAGAVVPASMKRLREYLACWLPQ